MRDYTRKTTRVIPTVYDDSLSYYETLCKFANALEDMREVLDGGIVDYIKEGLGDLIYRASYNKDTECITFAYDVIKSDGDDVHYYNSTDKTIYISKEE